MAGGNALGAIIIDEHAWLGDAQARGAAFAAFYPLQLHPGAGRWLGGALLADQKLAPGTFVYALAALAGAVIGTAIGRRWMSERGTRCVLAAILLFA